MNFDMLITLYKSCVNPRFYIRIKPSLPDFSVKRKSSNKVKYWLKNR